MRAIALLSGGLDSTLAIRVILDQGIEVEALSFVTLFCTCTPGNNSCSAARNAVNQLGIGLKVENSSEQFLEIVKNPKHGYGRNLNPCLDCRIMMFRRAKEHMYESGASFIITGEVVGERPMSQRREAMMLIEKEAGLEGLIVRPLSAGLLEPSIPEQKGWIDRSQLLSIHGRSRKPQIALADSYGISDYPCPAGGCRLTDPGYAALVKDLLTYEPGFSTYDAQFLRHGRHFRLSADTKAIVGRNERENRWLLTMSTSGDRLLEVVEVPGPLTLCKGPVDKNNLLTAGAITARFSKARTWSHVEVAVYDRQDQLREKFVVVPADDQSLRGLRIR